MTRANKKPNDIFLRVHTLRVRTFINRSFFINCLVWQLGPPGTAGSLASADTSLLVYKKGVPVAQQPREEAGKQRQERK
jgi:hypothetical protein